MYVIMENLLHNNCSHNSKIQNGLSKRWPGLFYEKKGQHHCGVYWSSWWRRWVLATILGDGFLGGRISRLFVGRRMDCVANSVVAALNEWYYSGRQWPQRSCLNTLIILRVSEKLKLLTFIMLHCFAVIKKFFII